MFREEEYCPPLESVCEENWNIPTFVHSYINISHLWDVGLFFQFIVERIDESLVITGVKMEEEVPRTLQYIGYPFTVAKSCLKSVGSPHAWPILLGALMWLINVSAVDFNYHTYVRM